MKNAQELRISPDFWIENIQQDLYNDSIIYMNFCGFGKFCCNF